MAILDQLESLILANFPQHKTVADCLAELGAPSTSIAVLDNGVLSARCYSTVDDDIDTLFQACSISKALNALAVMKLIDEGRFALASTVAELLPKAFLDILADGSPAEQRPLVESITVKQLLSHTSGIYPSSFPGYPSTSVTPSMHDILAGAKPANTPRFRMTSPPGYRYSYSGAGATVLQLVLEAVTGKDYRDLMRELILEPLDMTRSFYGPLKDSEKKAAKAYWTGYTECDVHHHYLPELAAAGLWTTPTDLLKAIQDVQKSLSGTGGLLRQDTAKEMITEIKGGMALGWETVNKNKCVFGHSGSNDPGYRCMAIGFAKQGDQDVPPNSGIVVMTNSAIGHHVSFKLLEAVAGLKCWPFPSYTDMVPRLGRSASESGEDWKGWKGTWKGDDAHTYVIEENSDGLPCLVYHGLGKIRLLPAVDSRRSSSGNGSFIDFIFEGMAVMSVRLEEKDGARIVKLGSLGDEPIELKRE